MLSATNSGVQELLREALRAEREVVRRPQKLTARTARAFWNELSSVADPQPGTGVLTHFVGIQSDVTARVEFEAASARKRKAGGG